MAQVKFVSGMRPNAGLRDTSPKRRLLEPALVEKAFSAKAAGSSRGLDLFAIRDAMEKMLRSTGGRPALQGTTAQAKIPRISEDWNRLQEIALAANHLRHKPSTGQIAAVVLHLALERIPAKDLEEAARAAFA